MRIGRLSANCAFSEDTLALGGSTGGARALSLASIDVLEGTRRDLRRHHTDWDLAWGWSQKPDASERARDRELGFTLRPRNCRPVRRAEREETVADTGGPSPPATAFIMQPTADRSSPSATWRSFRSGGVCPAEDVRIRPGSALACASASGVSAGGGGG
jgi:hypothetical protein